MKKVINVQNLYSQKVTRIPFTGEFLEAFGKPQDSGFWFIYGNSGSGKSSFVMQLAREFTNHYKVLYNVLEEETSDSYFIDRAKLFNLHDNRDRFFAASFNPEELETYLDKVKGRTKVVIIDSATYFTKDFEVYRRFKEKYWNTHILIFTGHAKGQEPKTSFEEAIKYDAKMKFFTSGYLAICQGRTIGKNGGRFIIWDEGYNKIQGANASKE